MAIKRFSKSPLREAAAVCVSRGVALRAASLVPDLQYSSACPPLCTTLTCHPTK